MRLSSALRTAAIGLVLIPGVLSAQSIQSVSSSSVPRLMDLETEVTDLKNENEALKQRLVDLERLVTELRASTPRR